MSEPRPNGLAARPPAGVLFLCVHNASRSQMAERFARALAPPGVVVMSAGSAPTTVHPRAAEVMGEMGLDLGGQSSKRIADVDWRACDTVVTLCDEAGEACPAVAGDVRRMHWPLPDPSVAPPDRQLEVFRAVRDEIRWRVSSLWPRSG